MAHELFNVYIDGARATAPDAGTQLARAIAARYGIAAAMLEERFAQGRFRVKGNVDRATADSYVADLSSLGAVCSLEAVAEARPAAAAAVTLPGAQRVARPAPAPSMSPPSAGPAQDLGALSGEVPLTLSTLDGASEDEARASRKIAVASFGPPAEDSGRGSSRKIALPASFGPPADDSAGRSSSRKLAVPPEIMAADATLLGSDDDGPIEMFDPFAPPEMQGEEQLLDLAVERRPRQTAEPAPSTAAAPTTMAPPPVMAAPPESSAQRAARPARSGGDRGPLAFLRDDVIRFAVGVLLAVGLAAIPALAIGSARQHSAFRRLDTELDDRQRKATTPDEWAQLDRVRASFLDRMHDERQTIAITTLLMWAVLSGGLAWLWFRKIDWDRVLR